MWESSAEKRDLVHLRHGDRKWGEVAIALNAKYGQERTPDSCSAKYRRMRIEGELYAITMQDTHKEPTYDELVKEWNEWLGRGEVRATPIITETANRRRVGILSDSHCPYESKHVIEALLADGPYDIVIHAGDLLDYESVSTFVHDRGSSMRAEIQHGTLLLEELSRVADEVIVTTDNHSRRILKRLNQSNLPSELLEMLSWLAPHIDLFELMSEGLPNVKIASRDKPAIDGSPVTLSFLVQRGDLIVGHPDTASKIPLRSVHNFDEWLVQWKDTLGLSPWRVVAMGHTHQTGMSFEQGGHKLYMELGASVTIEGMQYVFSGKVGYRPPVPTYTVLEQDMQENGAWVTDFNSVRQVVVL